VHLITCFKTNNAVNSAIKEGVVIAGKRVWARWMQKEPRRCLKCQSLTARHLAAKCNQQRTCGTREHCMVECTKTNRDEFWCVSCSTSGHTSWDRLCLAFLAASKHMEESDPEYSYKYFPGQAAWTWEQQPGHGDHSSASRWESFHIDGFAQDTWVDDQQRHQNRFDACTRDDGWPTQMNTNGEATGGRTSGQATERAASRQSRLDEYTLMATGGIIYEHQASMPT